VTWGIVGTVTATASPTKTRLYVGGRAVAEDFPVGEARARLDGETDGVLWIDLLRPDESGLAAVAAEFALHPLAVEDATQEHERPKVERYRGHLFMNVYAVEFGSGFVKAEISAFVLERVLITVRKSDIDLSRLIERWDTDAGLAKAGGVAFLVYGLLDLVVDGHNAVAQRIDEAMDAVEDELVEPGSAPRRTRARGFALRKGLSHLRRVVAPMPEVVGQMMRNDLGLVGEELMPYFRDVEDHARRSTDQVEHLRDRINELIEADLNEQSNELNDITRKLAAWAAIIAVPTAITGFFGQNVPYWGYGKFSGFLASVVLLAGTAGGLYLYLKRRGWL
jgi:magnesium transporter